MARRFLVGRIHAAFFVCVSTWLVDLAITFVLAVELLFGSTAVMRVVITPMVITAAVLAVWFRVILAMGGGLIPAASFPFALRFPYILIVQVMLGCTASVRLTFTSTTVASVLMGIVASWLAAVVITMLALIAGRTVERAIIEVLFLPEVH